MSLVFVNRGKKQQRITTQIPEISFLCLQEFLASFEFECESVTKELWSVTLLSIKGNRRNSKQRPTATVCAAIERHLSSRRNSPWQMAGPWPPRPQAMLHHGTRIPNRALLSLSPAATWLTMLSHLPDLLWLPSLIMTVERPTQRRSRGSLSLERGRILGNLAVIDLSISPPLVDLFLISLQTACVYGTDCFDFCNYFKVFFGN